MTKRQEIPPAVRALHEERLSADACAEYLAVPPSEEERQAISELLVWFMRRYPTARERLSYARRKYAEWTRAGVKATPDPR